MSLTGISSVNHVNIRSQSISQSVNESSEGLREASRRNRRAKQQARQRFGTARARWGEMLKEIAAAFDETE